MKKSSILILVVIAIAIAVIIACFGRMNTYATFSTAAQAPGQTYDVICVLDKDSASTAAAPQTGDSLTFFAKDKKGLTYKVIYSGTVPQDYEKAKQLLLTGYVKDGSFYCNSIKTQGL